MSSGSWSGGRGADILDLDRYMRPREAPSVPAHRENGNGLVVDNGGPGLMRPLQPGSMSSVSVEQKMKHYSHDSGLSDESPRPRARPPRNSRRHYHERSVSSDGVERQTRKQSKQRAVREGASGREDEKSLRAFRMECERALKEHKEQLQRVADICERLTTNQLPPQRMQQVRNRPPRSSTPGTFSSTTGSSSDRRPNQRPRDEYKTYKMLLNKFDELHQLLKTRGARPQTEPRAVMPHARGTSDMVSVIDKVVATDTPPRIRSNNQSPRKFEVQVALRDRGRSPNVTRTVDRLSGDDSVCESVIGNTKYPFNLEDPIQLYAQAKHLQAVHNDQHRRKKQTEERSWSVCDTCRRYWNSLKTTIINKYFQTET